MVKNLKERWLYFILLTHLVFVLPGSFIPSQGLSLGLENLSAGRPDSDGYFSLIAYPIDWLAKDAVNIGRARKFSSSPLRNSLLSVFISIETCIATACSVGLCFQAIKTNNTFIEKTNIPLKLQI